MKEIKRLENKQYRYFVTEDGRVFTKNKVSGDLQTKRTILKSGYYCVRVRTEGRDRQEAVHRLVAEAFIPNPENKPQVNHIDGDKLNNNVSNLEWVTNRENTIHARAVLGAFTRKDMVHLINIISKERVSFYKDKAHLIRQTGNFFLESLRGNFISGNTIAVYDDEYNSSSMDEMIRVRVNKRASGRGHRKFCKEEVDNLINMCKRSSVSEVVKIMKIDRKVLNAMIKGVYFENSKLHSKDHVCGRCFYQGTSKIDFRRYGLKI